MNNDKRIQSSAKEKSLVKRCLALLTCIGMLGSFMMPYQGVLPVVAEESSNVNSNGVFTSPQSTEIGDDFSDNLTKITVTSNGQTYTTSPVEIDAGQATSIGLNLALEYEYTKGQLDSSNLLNGTPYVYYRIPSNIRLDNDFYNDNMKVFDNSAEHVAYSGTAVSGYYSIYHDPTTGEGLITIRFTDDYIQYLSHLNNGFSGKIDFNGKVDRADDADGDKNFSITKGEVDLEFDLKFDDDKLSITKNGTVGKSGNGQSSDSNRYIDWTITITNPSGHINMSSYQLTDTMTGTNANWSNVENVTVSPSDNVTNNGDGTFDFNGSPETVTISYREKNVAYGTYKNDATVIDTTEDDEICHADSQITINNSISVTKYGIPDYHLAGGVVDDKIQWTVTVENMAGDSLRGAVVSDSKLTTGNATVYYYENGVRNELSSSYYTLSNGNLTFNNSNHSIPSKVEIVYMSDVTIPEGSTSVTDTNSVSVTSTNEKNPSVPDNPVEQSVTYNHELSVAKKGAAFDSENGKVQWKVTVLTGNENKESVNGYTITDDVFQYVNFTDLGGAVGFNAYYQDAWNENYKCKDSENTYGIYFTKSEDGKTVTINIPNRDNDAYTNEDPNYPINKFELYYWVDMDKCTFDGYSTAEDAIAAYNNGTEVTARNSASAENTTGKVSGEGEGTQAAKIRIEATKEYTSSNKNETVVGMGDTANRILDWKMTLTKDNGFGGGEVSVTDVLKSENDADHYITPAQVGAIKLYGKTTKDGSRTLIQNTNDTTYYYVTGTDDSSITANATGFKVKFDDAVGSFGYRYIEIEYQTTAEAGDVANGNSEKFSNEYTFGGTTRTTDGLTFERHDPNDVWNIKLGLTKEWDDRQNALDTRPSSITVKVLRTTQENPADIDWEEYKVYNLDVNDVSSYEYFTLDEDFPQWKVTGTAPNETIERYYYKTEEVISDDDNYTVGYSSNLVYAESDGEFKLRNTLKDNISGFGKKAVDNNGNSVKEVDYTSLTPVELTVNGETAEYYVFRWMISFAVGDNADNSKQIVYTDTMPDGAVYLDNSYNDYKPQIAYGKNSTWWQNFPVEYPPGNLVDEVTVDENTLTLRLNETTWLFVYYTAIPVDDFTSVLKDGCLVNTVTHDNDTKSAQLEIKNVPTPPVDTSTLIKKTAFNDAGSGLIKYGIEFNQNAQKLSNESKVDITDILSLNPSSTKSMDDLGIKLYAINVYPYDENGNIDRTHKLLASDSDTGYGYLVNYKVTENFDVSIEKKTSERPWIWEISGWESGNSMTVEVQHNSDGGNSFINGLHLKYISDSNYQDLSNWPASELSSFQPDESGKSVVTFSVPADCTKLGIVDYGNWGTTESISSVTVSSKKITPAELTISVPDKQHLYIEYIYQITGYDEKTASQAGDTIIFDNTASFKADNAEGSDTANGLKMSVEESHAQSEAKTYPKIYKVDVSNYAMNQLDSEFKIAKYVDGKWVYANSITTVEVNNTKHRVITFPSAPYTGYLESETTYPSDAATLVFGAEDVASTTSDDESVHNFSLEEGTLYKFVEIQAPTGNYRQPTFKTGGTFAENESFVFYYNYTGYSGSIPEEAQSKVVQIQENETINIPNNQTIEIDAVKTFSGSNVPQTWSAQMKLYWSTTKNGADLYEIKGNTNSSYDLPVANTFNAIATVDNTDFTAEWAGLPSGRNGLPVYYFVKEVSYTVGGDTFTYDEARGKYLNGTTEGIYSPVYTKNGANTDGTTIEVNNSQGIVVKKLWQNSNGKNITAPNEATENATEKMSVPFEVYGINETTRTLYYSGTLTAESYECVLPASSNNHSLSDFDNFEVVEKLTDEQKNALGDKWQSSTTRKITNGVGTLEIINTKQVSSSTNADVQKIWSDGESNHTSDSVTAYLIQSTSELTPAQLKKVEANDSDKPTYYTGENMLAGDDILLVMKDGTKTVSNVKSFEISDTSVASGAVSSDVLTITGVGTGTTDISIVRMDDTVEDYTVSVINPKVTLSSGNWSAQWENLPVSCTDGENEITFYYYAIEENVPTGYTSSYQLNDQQTIIKNSKPAKLNIVKVWDGISSDDEAIYKKDVIAELQYKIGSDGEWTSYNTAQKVTLRADSWTGSFSNLPQTDNNGNVYHYRVVEKQVGDSEDLTAFLISYSSDDITFEDLSEKTITITNQLNTIDLRVKKEWVGKVPTDDDSVTIQIHRSTDIAAVPTNVETIATETTTVTEETTTTTTTTTAIETTTTVATTETTSTTATTEEESKNRDYVPTFAVASGDKIKITISGGQENEQISAKIGYNVGDDWDWNETTLNNSFDSNGKIEIIHDIAENYKDNFKLMIFDNGGTEPRNMTVSFEEITDESGQTDSTSKSWTSSEIGSCNSLTPFNFNGNVKQLTLNFSGTSWNEVTVYFDSNTYSKIGYYFGSLMMEVTKSSITNTTIPKSKIQNSDGDYNNGSDLYYKFSGSSITLNFSESDNIQNIYFSGNSMSEVSCSYELYNSSLGASGLPHRPTRPVELDIVSNSTEAPLAQATPSLVSNKILSKMMGARSGEVERMMELRTQENTLLTLNDTINLFYATSGITIIPVFNEPVVVTSSDDWEKEIQNLPAYDLNGNPYYYWAEETAGSDGYAVSYQFDDGNPSTIYCIDSSNLGSGLITVQNKKEETPEGADLPTSGGSGTAPYRTAGFLLMMTAVTFPYIKHRNRRKRNSA